MSEENELIRQRREKLGVWRESTQAFPNTFRPDALAANLHDEYSELDKEALAHKGIRVAVSGRLMTRRIMGKASFAHLQDRSGQIQIYVQRDALPEGVYNAQFKSWDIGDIIGVTGKLFKTNKGELSIHCDGVELLVKSLRPLPEKYHGLTDKETAYRQRYVDLMMSAETRNVFKTRSKIVSTIRRFLEDRDFLEVETPMMHPIPGGAVARPFTTHHNALNMPLYLRVAPELYLKRLVVGGLERVFEVNRNFRNEGLSTRHNPEFTMLEFYQAYADYEDLMALTETLLRELVTDLNPDGKLTYQGIEIDFNQPFTRLSMADSLLHHNEGLSAEDVNDFAALSAYASSINVKVDKDMGLGKLQFELFEATVEDRLMQPTFITEHPLEVSPLSRRNDVKHELTDRFELFIAGREIANGFSELNDPEDQAERFQAQVAAKDAGDQEAMHFDADYIRALEYGMPPTAGEGIGIDRLVMLLTDSPSIRDVLLFPHMRPESDSGN